MTGGKPVGFVGVDLGVVIDRKGHPERLLPKMRENGLIRADKLTHFITEKGRDAIADAAPIGSSRRAESTSHLFVAHRRFSALISWRRSSFIRERTGASHRLQIEVTQSGRVLPAVLWHRRWDGHAKPGRSKGHLCAEGAPLCAFAVLRLAPKSARDEPGRCRCGC
jgi:hypothetical protein